MQARTLTLFGICFFATVGYADDAAESRHEVTLRKICTSDIAKAQAFKDTHPLLKFLYEQQCTGSNSKAQSEPSIPRAFKETKQAHNVAVQVSRQSKTQTNPAVAVTPDSFYALRAGIKLSSAGLAQDYGPPVGSPKHRYLVASTVEVTNSRVGKEHTPNAQELNFEGVFFNINVELKSTSLKFADTTESFSGFGSANTIGSIGLEYATNARGRLLMLFGGKYDLGGTSIIETRTPDAAFSVKEKSHHQIYVAPATVLNPGSIAYIKFGYDKGKGEASLRGRAITELKTTGGTLGVGLRTRVAENTFLNIEAGRTSYNTDSSIVHAATIYGIAGLSFQYK